MSQPRPARRSCISQGLRGTQQRRSSSPWSMRRAVSGRSPLVSSNVVSNVVIMSKQKRSISLDSPVAASSPRCVCSQQFCVSYSRPFAHNVGSSLFKRGSSPLTHKKTPLRSSVFFLNMYSAVCTQYHLVRASCRAVCLQRGQQPPEKGLFPSDAEGWAALQRPGRQGGGRAARPRALFCARLGRPPPASIHQTQQAHRWLPQGTAGRQQKGVHNSSPLALNASNSPDPLALQLLSQPGS